MKKNYLILAAASIMAFASCVTPPAVEQNDPVVVKLTVNGEIATKTGVVDNGTTVKHVWSKNDKIKAFIGALDDTRTDVLTLANTSGEGVEKAVFEGKTNVKLERQAYQVYAVGPSANKVNEAKLNSEVATIALSSEQTPSAVGTFDRGADILVAKPVELNVADSLCTAEITFSRPAALVKVAISDPQGKIAGEVISSVKISTSATPIAGYLSVNLTNLETEVASSPSNDITVTYDEALNFVADGKNAAWIVAAPAEIPAGELTVTIVTDKNVVTKTFAEDVKLSQIKVNELTVTIDSGCQFTKKFVFSGGKGTDEDPFKLASSSDIVDLVKFSNGNDIPDAFASFDFSAAKYEIASDIVMSDGDSLAVSPFANADKPFTGVINGANHKISGLYINNKGDKDCAAGLVGYAGMGAVIKDLTLENYKLITIYRHAGGFVGEATGVTLTNLKITGGKENSSLSSSAKWLAAGGTDAYGAWYPSESNVNAGVIGGIAGYAQNVTVSNCTVDAKVYGTQRYVGGIVAFVDKGEMTTITDCTIPATAYVGSNNTNAGGIVGSNRDGNLTITGCKVYSEVYSKYSYIGGIIGASYGAKVENCEVVGSKIWISVAASTNASGASGNIAGIVGYHWANAFSIKNCKVNDCYIYGGHSVGGLIGIAGRTGETSGLVEIKDCTVAGDSIIAVRPHANNKVVFAGGVVGRAASYVTGIKIDNVSVDKLYISGVAQGVSGYIGYNETNTEIVNSVLSNSEIVNKCTEENAVITGGFVGYAQNGTFTGDNLVAKNTTITGRAYLGLIAGQAAGKGFTLTNCVAGSDCKIVGTYSVGGILGGCQAPAPPFKMIIDKCSSYVSIESTSNQVGGIVGLLGNSTARVGTVAIVSNCYYGKGTLMTTHASPYIGGVVGRVGNFNSNQTDHMANYLVNNFARPEAVIATNDANCTDQLIGGAYGALGFGAHTFGAWTDVKPAQVTSQLEKKYPVFGSVYNMEKWDNSVDYIYYDAEFENGPGKFTMGETDSVKVEHIEALSSFTDGTLLAKMNEAATAYNAAPLIEGVRAETWVAGTDGYPTLSTVLPDPDAK